jgi:aminoglycoside 6'-N-acetyltransferase
MPSTNASDRGPALLTQLPTAAGPVRVRALRGSDLELFLAYRSDPKVARYQGWSPMSPEQAAGFLAEMAGMARLADLADKATWPEGAWLQLAIASTDDDRLVGDIGLLHEAPGQVQLGYTLARQAQGRGWAQAALRPLCSLLLGAQGGRCLRAISDSRNAGSLRLLERLGFMEVGREAVVLERDVCTDVVFERLAGSTRRDP